jgi:hypothetical protein
MSSTFTAVCILALTFEKYDRPFHLAPFLVTFKQIMKLGMSQMPASSYVVMRSLFHEGQTSEADTHIDSRLHLTKHLTAHDTLKTLLCSSLQNVKCCWLWYSYNHDYECRPNIVKHVTPCKSLVVQRHFGRTYCLQYYVDMNPLLDFNLSNFNSLLSCLVFSSCWFGLWPWSWRR